MVSDDSKRILPSLRKIFADMDNIYVAYSGGLDSRFLCHAALLCGLKVTAIHVSGPHISKYDSHFARKWANDRGLEFVEIYMDPLNIPDIANNTRKRCYACKKELFSRIYASIPDAAGKLCDGGNLDDRKKFRPGMAAVKEANVRSPLAEAGLDKAAIIHSATITGMDLPGQKARPCLLTRYPYNAKPDKNVLAALADAEEEIGRCLSEFDFRLRLLPEPTLQVDHEPGEYREHIGQILKKNGFSKTAIEILPSLEGFFDRMRKREG